MEVKPGYKQTEVGMIPEDWEVAKLSRICSMKSGEGITSANIDQFSRYPCYGGNGLRGFTSRFTHNGCYALIGRQGALCGNVLGVEGMFFASEHAVVVTALARTDIHWLTVVLGDMRLNQYSESSAQPGLSVSKILNLPLALPPLPEQRAIAGALGNVDALLGALEKLIAKKRDLKQAAMQQLLTGKTRLPGFHGKWKVKLLAELCDLQTGRRPKGGVTEEGDIPSLGGENIFNSNGLDLSTVKKVSESFFAEMRKGVLKDRDVLINKDGANTGKVAIYINSGFPRACINEHLFIMRGKGGTDNGFLYYAVCLESSRKEISKHIASSAQPGLNRGFVNVVSIRVPEPDEQTAIAGVLSDMDAEIEALEQRLAKTRALKQGMMQELLTGRIRLI